MSSCINIGEPKKMLSGGTPTKNSNGDALNSSPRATKDPPAGPFGNATMKEPSGDVASSLSVVCYPCLSELGVWKYIKGSGSCKEPSHKYNKVHFPTCTYICMIIYEGCTSDHVRMTNSYPNSYPMQVYYVWYYGYPYPIREATSDSILKLCNNDFKCRYGLQCKYAHCEEELSYWRGTYIMHHDCSVLV